MLVKVSSDCWVDPSEVSKVAFGESLGTFVFLKNKEYSKISNDNTTNDAANTINQALRALEMKESIENMKK